MTMSENDWTGSAYGSDPTTHHVVDGEFVCTAPSDAKCRTFPTCECENWCCCETPGENHDDGDHCCMATVEPGQGCWLGPWIDAVGVADAHCEESVAYDDDGEPLMPDGAVGCDWDDGICWAYAPTPSDLTTTPDPAPREVGRARREGDPA